MTKKARVLDYKRMNWRLVGTATTREEDEREQKKFEDFKFFISTARAGDMNLPTFFKESTILLVIDEKTDCGLQSLVCIPVTSLSKKENIIRIWNEGLWSGPGFFSEVSAEPDDLRYPPIYEVSVEGYER